MLLPISLLFFSFHALATPVLKRQAPSFNFAGDAPFSVAPEVLAAALTCPNGNPTTDSPPVLLVHGTASTGAQTWGNGYVPALLANSYTACYVTLPSRAMGDMQVSSEYVAYALHLLSTLSSGLPPAVIAHSQGNPDVQWALRFWPSTRAITRAFVALAPDFQGIQLLNSNLSHFCQGDDLCQPSIWQQSAGSAYYAALHYQDYGALVPTTSIYTEVRLRFFHFRRLFMRARCSHWGFMRDRNGLVWRNGSMADVKNLKSSQFDEVVVPSDANANLPSANVMAVQDLCPARFVDHILMTIDAAGFALALDALNNDGIASLDRVRPQFFDICFRIAAPHMSLTVATDLAALWGAAVDGFILGAPRVTAEPPVMQYALPAATNSSKI